MATETRSKPLKINKRPMDDTSGDEMTMAGQRPTDGNLELRV